jgi:2-methylisocitrate lyase-like PEP mutase family enzyme
VNSQIEKAKQFKALHIPHDPLILCNIWDAGSALAVERSGAKVIATSSWSMAAAQGYADGEQLPLADALAIIARIIACVKTPVSVDFEGGYAADPERVGQNIAKLLSLGAVGFNFEDQVVDGPGLYSIADQARRLRAARQAADALAVPALINARTDVVLKAAPGTAHVDLMDEILAREKAYKAAGADGFFIPGLSDEKLIRQICDAATLPINIMTAGGADDVSKLAELGVARISLGPAPYISLVAALERQADGVLHRR